MIASGVMRECALDDERLLAKCSDVCAAFEAASAADEIASIRSVYGSIVACKVLLDVDEKGAINPCTSLQMLNDDTKMTVEDSFMADDRRSLAALMIVDEMKRVMCVVVLGYCVELYILLLIEKGS